MGSLADAMRNPLPMMRRRSPGPTSSPKISATESFVANAALTTALFPFAAPFPIPDRDVQILASVVAAVACGLAIRSGRTRAFVDRQSCALLTAGWVCLLYVRWDLSELNALWLQRCGAVLLSMPVYWAARAWYDALDYRVVVAVAVTYAAVAAAQLASPEATNAIATTVLGGLRFSLDAGRGATSLTPEPSALAAVAILLLWGSRLLPASAKRSGRYLRGATAAIAILLVLASGSLLGIVLLAAMGVAELFSTMRWVGCKHAAALASVVAASGAAFIGVASTSDTGHRAMASVRAAVADPTTLLFDTSLQARIVGTVLSIQTLTVRPMGTGQVQLDENLAAQGFSGPAFDLLANRPALLKWLYDFVWVYGFTEMGRGIQRMGVAYFAILGILFLQIRGFRGAGPLQLWLLAILTQNSLYMPTIWLVLGLATERSRATKRRPATSEEPTIHSGTVTDD